MSICAIFDVKVKTNAKEARIRRKNLTLFVDVKAQPKEGKANEELLKQLKKLFKRDIEIVKGHSSKEKKVLVHNLTPQDASKILSECEEVK